LDSRIRTHSSKKSTESITPVNHRHSQLFDLSSKAIIVNDFSINIDNTPKASNLISQNEELRQIKESTLMQKAYSEQNNHNVTPESAISRKAPEFHINFAESIHQSNNNKDDRDIYLLQPKSRNTKNVSRRVTGRSVPTENLSVQNYRQQSDRNLDLTDVQLESEAVSYDGRSVNLNNSKNKMRYVERNRDRDNKSLG